VTREQVDDTYNLSYFTLASWAVQSIMLIVKPLVGALMAENNLSICREVQMSPSWSNTWVVHCIKEGLVCRDGTKSETQSQASCSYSSGRQNVLPEGPVKVGGNEL